MKHEVHKWFDDTLEAECAAATYAHPSGMTLRPNSTGCFELRWSF